MGWFRKKPLWKSSPTRAQNVSGKYYVDGWSLCCGLCPQLAPNNCRINEKNLTCEVFKQPETAAEKEQLQDAIAHSCVQCIRDDGDDKHGQPKYEPLPAEQP